MPSWTSFVNRLLIVVITTALFSGCSSRTVVESDLGIKGAPEWVNDGKQALNDGDKRFFRGIGSAPSMNDVSLQKNTADNRARSELAQVFSAYMDVIASDYSAAATDGDATLNEQMISRTLKSATQLNLVGAQIIARWRDKKNGTIYSLAEVDLEQFKQVSTAAENMDPTLKFFIETQSKKIFDSFQQGKNQ